MKLSARATSESCVKYLVTMKTILLIFAGALALSGCDNGRIKALEVESAELKEAAKKRTKAEDFDSQTKCSAGAVAMFNDWEKVEKESHSNTMMDYRAHFNSAANKCFVTISRLGRDGHSLSELVSLMNVYENSNDGEYWEYRKKKNRNDTATLELYSCRVFDKKCGDRDEFDKLVKPVMTE
jgi:hypothetical protein